MAGIGNHKKTKAQSMVEFALVLPILLFVIFGVLDLGRAFFAVITITNASREGARYATLHNGGTESAIKQAAVNEASSGGITLQTADVDIVCADVVAPAGYCDRNHPITVTVEHDLDLIMGFILPSPVHFQRSTEMLIP